MDQLRLSAFDPTEHPDAQSYLQQLRANFIRSTGLDCLVDASSISFALPQAAELTHSAASPLPTKPKGGFAGSPFEEGSAERQAQAMIEKLAKYGALEVVHNG